jgi:hypothetical protein
MYPNAIQYIDKKKKKYLDKFFELSAIDEYIKKQTIRIFLNISMKMHDSFDVIEKAAVQYGIQSETAPF